MKRIVLTAAVLTAIAGGGFALAQAPKQTPPSQSAPGPGMMSGGNGYGMMGNGYGMMGGGNGYGMMGGGMMGMMGGGMMGMMGGAATKIDVKKIDKGVTITMTSSDAPTAARLQKMWEAMRLMHEAMTQ
jgi:hypothetical protein